MNWGSASEFFAMGGYAFFVWGSYGVALAALVIEPILAARRHREALSVVADAADEAAALNAGAAPESKVEGAATGAASLRAGRGAAVESSS